MAVIENRTVSGVSKRTPPESDPTKTDRNTPAGSENFLSGESAHDDRRSTDDSVAETMDQENPGLVSE